MNAEDLSMIICALPCLSFWLGALAGMMYSTFAYEDRISTNRIENAKPGTTPFRPDSKLKKWHRSNDMLENGSHPSIKDED